jgi:hypothetical protein
MYELTRSQHYYDEFHNFGGSFPIKYKKIYLRLQMVNFLRLAEAKDTYFLTFIKGLHSPVKIFDMAYDVNKGSIA